MPTLDDLLKNALELDVRDRAALAEELLASIDSGDCELSESDAERLWIEEAEIRLEEHNSGRSRAIPSAAVAAKAEKLVR
ncbi:MAG TPA: addiction module protein [Bryobacteraceae bacterium]